MINVAQQLLEIETRAKGRVAIRDICKEAGIAASNWARWKRKNSATTTKLELVVNAADRLLLSEQCSRAADDKAAHAVPASSNPTAETPLELCHGSAPANASVVRVGIDIASEVPQLDGRQVCADNHAERKTDDAAESPDNSTDQHGPRSAAA